MRKIQVTLTPKNPNPYLETGMGWDKIDMRFFVGDEVQEDPDVLVSQVVRHFRLEGKCNVRTTGTWTE